MKESEIFYCKKCKGDWVFSEWLQNYTCPYCYKIPKGEGNKVITATEKVLKARPDLVRKSPWVKMKPRGSSCKKE